MALDLVDRAQSDGIQSDGAQSDGIQTDSAGSDEAVAAPRAASGPSHITVSAPLAEPLAGATLATPPSAVPPNAAATPASFAGPAVAAAPGDDAQGDTFDAYAHHPPFHRRRSPARLWTYAASAIALVLLSVLGGLWWYGPERIASLLGIQTAAFDTPLLIMSQVHPSQRTPSGNELLPVSGRIVNSADTAQPVPDILVEILDVHGRAVYSWTIPHPTSTIAARGSVPFNSATVDPPQNAVKLRFSFIGTART